MEIFDGVNKKPFKSTGLLNKSQLKLASYIKANKDVTLQGTKRFTDKSGEYYLKNIQLQNTKQESIILKKNTLNKPQNLENCLNRDINKIKKRASKIVTLLPENSLTPIPKKDGLHKTGLANRYGKKELDDAQRTAVFIRRMEYATSMKRSVHENKSMKSHTKKIILIQEWWRTIFKIIKLQKNIRGFLFRKKLMNNLEHQEKLLQFITEFDNIYNYHLFRKFMDNLKKKRDYVKAKLMEKCEDFNEKLDNLEKIHNIKNFKKCFQKWKNIIEQKRKEIMDNFSNKINDILTKRIKTNNLDTFKMIKDRIKLLDDSLNDKAKAFRENNDKKKFLKNLINAHRLNKMLLKLKKKFDPQNKKYFLDKLKNNKCLIETIVKLNKLLENKKKRKAFDDLKKIYFMEKIDEIINNHNEKINDKVKKELLYKLKDVCNKSKLKNALKKWKDFNDEMKNRKKIISKLKRYKINEFKKKEEEEKNKLAISSGINDFELVSNKKNENHKSTQIFSTSQNEFVFEGRPSKKLIFEKAEENFSLIAPEYIKFEFRGPLDKNKKTDNNPLENQLNELDDYRNKNNLKKCVDLWKEKMNKKEIMNRLNDLVKKQKEKEEKLNGIIDLVQSTKDNQDLKEYLSRWKNNTNQIKKDSLNNLVNKLSDIFQKAKKETDDQFKEDLLFKLRKNTGMSEGFRILEKVFKDNKNKDKSNFLDRLKKNADTQKAIENIDALIEKKFREKLFTYLKIKSNLEKAGEILDKTIKNRIKKDCLNDLVKKYKWSKICSKLEKILVNKLKKKFLDRLIKNNLIQKVCDKLQKVIDERLKKDVLYTMQKIKDLSKATEILEKIMKTEGDNEVKNNNFKKLMDNLRQIQKNMESLKKAINHWKEIKDLEDILNKLKDYLKNKNNSILNITPVKSKRISRRVNPYKKRAKKKKNNKKDLLRIAFNRWRKNVSFESTRNVLDRIKKNKLTENLDESKKDEILSDKNKNRIMKVLLDKYQKKRILLLKHYFNKWKKSKIIYNEQEKIEPKYKKKPKIGAMKDISDSDNNSFNPTYYQPKHNLYSKRETLYKKKYAKRPLEILEENKNDDFQKNENNKTIPNRIYKNKKQYSDTSSDNESAIGNGINLIQNKKIIRQPRNYTSQSFFIDKNNKNNLAENNYQINSHIANHLPMTMKGDFVSLIEQNPNILAQKNPRIQVTNAMCDLDQIMSNENTEEELNIDEMNSEISKLNNDFIINKNKVLSKVIKHCDKDLYSSQRPFRTKKDEWYSVSIPLNDNEAKWEFLNNIKGERDKNNLNKFELMQKENEPTNKEKESSNKKK